jgi:hypothetical protein
LQKLPIAWGNSWQTLKNQCYQVGEVTSSALQSTHKDTEEYILSFDVAKLELSGQDASILSFDFMCEAETPLPMQIAWEDAETKTLTERASLHFTAQSGHLVVPIDSYPRWLLAKRINTLQFRFSNHCRSFSLDNMQFFQRNSVPKM